MDGKEMTKKDENKYEINEDQMDFTEYMFRPTENAMEGSELNASNNSCEDLFYGTFYSPFFNESDKKKDPVKENTTISRIGPFTDNRPICECEMVKQMTANPDVRYLLSLLPDMAEMNTEQKSVFKTRVITLLHKTLLVES